MSWLKYKFKINTNTGLIERYQGEELGTIYDVEREIDLKHSDESINAAILKAYNYECDKVNQIIESVWWKYQDVKNDIVLNISDIDIAISTATTTISDFNNMVNQSLWYIKEKQKQDLLKINNRLLDENVSLEYLNNITQINENINTINTNNLTITDIDSDITTYKEDYNTVIESLNSLETQRTFNSENVETTDPGILSSISSLTEEKEIMGYGFNFKLYNKLSVKHNKSLTDLINLKSKLELKLNDVNNILSKFITGSYIENGVTVQLPESEYYPWLNDYSDLTKYDNDNNLITRPVEDETNFIKEVSNIKIKFYDNLVNEVILNGFESNATGTLKKYSGEIENQINIIGAVIANVDLLYTCTDVATGVKTQVLHTADQLKSLFFDAITFKAAKIELFNQKRDLLNNATSLTDIINVNSDGLR